MRLQLVSSTLKNYFVTFAKRPFAASGYRQMALLTQLLNPMTGQNEWQSRDDDYDYHQEVANAGFGDMLHDTERNYKYYQALRKTIARMQANGQEAHVLDIGTGTGILAMMAVAAGANTVTACEAFVPMANCAERIIRANGMADRIHLVKKRSTEVQVGVDMARKANLLVSEVLDTELIGEGAIDIYNHAHRCLLTEDVLCIPARAHCYAQAVESPLAAQWNTMKLLANLDGEVLLQPPADMHRCKGEAALHDVQLSQLPAQQFRAIAEPVEIFQFDFSAKEPRPQARSVDVPVTSTAVGSVDLVFYWWHIEMDNDNEVQLSCAPYWAHPDFKALSANGGGDGDGDEQRRPLANVIPWRDHWMQAIYYIPQPLQVMAVGEQFLLSANHDEYSLWFDAFRRGEERAVRRHTCSCNLHMTYVRNRIGQLNQAPRNKIYLRYLEQSITSASQVLVLGDGSLLGMAAAKLGASHVWCHEPHRFSRNFMESVARHNDVLGSVDFVKSLEELAGQPERCGQLTHVFAEPYFLTSILPWDNFYFGTLLQQIQQHLPPSVQISPHAARIYAVPVEFLDLHKIRMPIGKYEEFDLRLFDEMVESSAKVSQGEIEAQPLWEYPCRALAAPVEILNVVFRSFHEDHSNEGQLAISADGSCNGIALWVDWQVDAADTSKKSIVSGGPAAPIVPGEYIKWDMFVRQGVQLLRKAHEVHPQESSVDWSVDFKPQLGQIQFKFNVKS